MFLIFIELCIFLIIKLNNKKKRLGIYGEIGYIYLSLGYSIRWLLVIIADFYNYSSNLRKLYLFLGFFILSLVLLIFLYITENKSLELKKFFFTKSYSLILCIYLVIWIFNNDYILIITIFSWLFFLIYIFIYYRNLYRQNYLGTEPKKIKFEIASFLIGFSLMALGFQIIQILRLIDNYFLYRFIADFFQIFGAYFLFIFFSNIPSLSELHWRERLGSIFIIHKSGLLLYKKDLNIETNYIEDSLKSGGIVTIEMILQNINNSILSSIERKDNKITIFSGVYIYTVIISMKSLKVYQYISEKITNRIETIYYHILGNWNGDLRVLSPIEDIINDILKIRK